MRKTHPTIAALAAVTIAFAACEQRTADETGEAEEEVTVETTEDLETQLDEFRTGYEEAWNARNWDALGGMYTEDYEEFTPEGRTLGHAEVQASLRDGEHAPPEGARLSIDTETMRVAESGDIAYATGTSSVEATGPDGQPMTMEERWMAGFEREDGEWKLDRLIRTSTDAGATGEAAPMGTPAGGATGEVDTTAM